MEIPIFVIGYILLCVVGYFANQYMEKVLNYIEKPNFLKFIGSLFIVVSFLTFNAYVIVFFIIS